MKIQYIYTRPDTSIPFWQESDVFKSIWTDRGGFEFNDASENVIAHSQREYSDDGLTLTVTQEYPNNESRKLHLAELKKNFPFYFTERMLYLTQHSHNLKIILITLDTGETVEQVFFDTKTFKT
jgi:hypothetical protein